MTSFETALADYGNDLSWLSAEAERTAAALAARTAPTSIDRYDPSPRQSEFHAAGRDHRERLFMAGNQLGKTLAGAMECAMHLTGRYPGSWAGRRFPRAVRLWVAGVTAESTRDNPQRMLLGPPQLREAWGTGAIPGIDVLGWSAGRAVPDGVDSVSVRHRGGDTSIVVFKNYAQGRQKWQGETLDGVWFDEEPPLDIYTEGLTRTNESGGFTMITFTPLLGMSEVVRLFLGAEASAS